MGFRVNVISILFLILCDAIFTVIRPTTADVAATMNVDVLDYVLVAAHCVTVLGQAVAIFSLFSQTVWFTAGLLGELFDNAKVTLPVWLFRFIWTIVPWVHRRFVKDLGDRAMEDGGYRFLYVSDMLLAVASWAALMYTAGCMTEKRMYSPYHREHLELPQVAFSREMGAAAFNRDVVSGTGSSQQQPQVSASGGLTASSQQQ